VQHPNDSDLDHKHEFEDEAEESEFADFINDKVSEESDTVPELGAAVAALRNRRSWKASQSSCALCNDLRVVISHLLGLD
jgi:hypothetical protein